MFRLAAISVSTSSVGGPNGGSSIQFSHAPGVGYGYTYGNVYPSYPTLNPYGQFYPGNNVQTSVSLGSRGSFGDDEQASGHTSFSSAPNFAGAPPVYGGPYLNNVQQQQNAYV